MITKMVQIDFKKYMIDKIKINEFKLIKIK